MPPGIHGSDVAYTFYNNGSETTFLGTAVNSTIALATQYYITSFVMTGSPNAHASGAPYFPIYGNDSKLQVLDSTKLGV